MLCPHHRAQREGRAPLDRQDRVHDHVVFHMSSGASVVFNDPRRFGYMKIIARHALEAEPLLKGLGLRVLGVVISYEVFFPDRAREAVRAGGRVVLVPTNAASYRDEQIPAQEVAVARLRALETGRAYVLDPRGVVRLLLYRDADVVCRVAAEDGHGALGDVFAGVALDGRRQDDARLVRRLGPGGGVGAPNRPSPGGRGGRLGSPERPSAGGPGPQRPRRRTR